MLRKLALLLFISFIFVLSCKKDGNKLSINDILSSHNWYPYQIQQNFYDSSETGYQLIKDSTFSADSCSLKSKFLFFAEGKFTIVSDCFNPKNLTGSWFVSFDSSFKALILNTDVSGNAYYFGISPCFIKEIDNNHFVTSDSAFYYHYSNGLPTKSVTVTFITYKN